MMKIRFLRASFFIWIILPAAAYLVYQIFGLPHFIWSYDWQDNGTYDPYTPRIYTRCTFYDPYGSFTTYPKNGKCEWFRFYKKSGGV